MEEMYLQSQLCASQNIAFNCMVIDIKQNSKTKYACRDLHFDRQVCEVEILSNFLDTTIKIT